ncbi:Abi family protein [Pseudomonas xantholysinigenes]|uniref:Abi family protein n=1 Tax=Pseudomonas xantholysinigenes TaxID=2745490 RepID=A0A9E6PW09_9PSED|nr:Abi family protein [Pseudomonas xantholysinigenes]QXI38520.1 Abi family protein [Pseudomonas xantholysinigenes]
MHIEDTTRTERKLAQLGYYRLSGFWYPARQFHLDPHQQRLLCSISRKPIRLDAFEPGTAFEDAVSLYKFDKTLRMLMLDAIERLEVHLKTVVAHEIGYHDPMAYTDVKYILPKWTQPYTDRNGNPRNKWLEWSIKQESHLKRSKEDCIQWHMQAKKSIPVWVAVEAWDFGDLSEFFELLSGKYQNLILGRLGLSDAKMFSRWLQQISHLRNRCAHHTRIWNQASPNPLSVPANHPYFQPLQLNESSRKRLYGLISIIWFLLKRIAPSSTWIREVGSLVDTKPNLPGCTYEAMGLPVTGFPRHLFS